LHGISDLPLKSCCSISSLLVWSFDCLTFSCSSSLSDKGWFNLTECHTILSNEFSNLTVKFDFKEFFWILDTSRSGYLSNIWEGSGNILSSLRCQNCLRKLSC
jgi:hypothetical protein